MKKKEQLVEINKFTCFYSALKVEKLIRFYEVNPDKFIEEILGVKLLSYQKLFLKTLNNKHKK